MTHSPTPTELLALRTANAALLNSPDVYTDFASTIVFALGSAQLLQSPETAAELSRLVTDRARWQSRYYEESRTYWDAELPPGGECCAECGQPVESEPCAEHHPATVAARLVEENERLRARVAELEAVQAPAGPYPQKTSYVVEMDGPLSPLGRKRPSLDEARKNVAAYRNHFPEASYRIVRWTETSAVVEADGGQPKSDARLDASVAKLRTLLAGQREDPHDSPLHHEYRLGHDLPEVPHG